MHPGAKWVKKVTDDQIPNITSLCKTIKASKKIVITTGLSLRNVQRRSRKYGDSGGVNPAL